MIVTQGSTVEITATANYNWTGNAYLQNVAASELYVDVPPWAGGTGLSILASDGSFDSPTEGARALLETGPLAVGRHVVLVRARGVSSYEGHQSWGPISAVFLDVVPADSTPTATAAVATATFTPLPTRSSTPAGTTTPTTTPCEMSFTDVHPDDYFYQAVSYLYCAGVISGYADGTFRPYGNATRGQLAKIVVLAEGWTLCQESGVRSQQSGAGSRLLTPDSCGQHFSDVSVDNPFYVYIETAYSHGVISGYADGTFRWANNITRGQLSKVIVLVEGWAINTQGGPHFSDVSVDNPFYTFVETAFNHEIISGYSDGSFRPGNSATRGQICKIIYSATPR
jgi:hypothetical protein